MTTQTPIKTRQSVNDRLAERRANPTRPPVTQTEAETEPASERLAFPEKPATPTPATERAYPVRTFSVQAISPDGWPCTFAWNDIPVEQFELKLQTLANRGYTPPAQPLQETPEGLPICRKHGVPMRRREKQGDVWFSHNVGDEDAPCYCRGYAGKDSPGWDR